VNNTSATPIWTADHLPFGEAVNETHPENDPGLRYPGQWTIPEAEGLGLPEMYYNLYRWYVPGWGRYGQADPIGLRGGVNLFGYGGQNPFSYIDPLGLKKCCSKNDDCPSGKWYYTGNIVSGFESWAGLFWGTGIINSTGTYICIGRESVRADVKIYCEVTHAIGFDIGWDLMEGWSWQSATGCNKKDLFTTTEGQAFSLAIIGVSESRPARPSATDNSNRGWTAGVGISLGAGWAETTCVVERK